MSGHNKWSKIKHKKAAEDAKKSKVFGILARQIALESKVAKGDLNSPKLRAVIEKARKENMPKENIDRAVAKGSGAGGQAIETIRYEGFGPGGVAIIVEGITDNPNRTGQEIRHILGEHEGSLGTPGSAAWAFERMEENGSLIWKAKTIIDLSDENLEKLSALVETLENHDDVETVYTNAE